MAPVSNQRWCIHFSWKKDIRRDIPGVGRTYRSGGGFFRCKYHNSVTLGKVSERWSVWTRETLRNSRDPAESLEWTTHWFSCISQPCQQIWPFISVRAQHGPESRPLPSERKITTYNSHGTYSVSRERARQKEWEWKKNWIDLTRWLLIICSTSTGRLSLCLSLSLLHEIY